MAPSVILNANPVNLSSIMSSVCFYKDCQEGCCDSSGLCPSKSGSTCFYYYNSLGLTITHNTIIGIVIGSLFVAAIIVAVVLKVYWSCRMRKQEDSEGPSVQMTGDIVVVSKIQKQKDRETPEEGDLPTLVTY